MPVAISSQMSTNLVSLLTVSSDMAGVQNRLATGKKVNDVTDGAAVYFRAKTLTEKADALDPVNANINAALSNVKVADKAINTMYDNLTGLLTTLRDARSKAITATANAAFSNTTAASYAATSLVAPAPAVPASPTAAEVAAFADPTRMQVGDTFAISFTDANNQTVSRFFQASATAGAGTQTGRTNGTAIQFGSAADLVTAFTSAFGRDDITLDFDAVSGKFSLAAANLGTSISVAQTTNAGNPGATNPNATIDFERVFGTAAAGNITRSGGNGQQIGGSAVLGTMVTVVGTGTAATAANLETRRLAADSYRTTMQQLANITKDAYLPGFVNLLQGNTMAVDLNEDTGDVVQNVLLGGAVDPVTLGFTGFNAATGDDNQSATNFTTDATITSAIGRVTNAMTTLRSRQGALGNHTAMLSTRLNFNKDFQTIVSDSATAITAADSNVEAASMAALQNRQAYAVNNMSVTKNQEQSLLQLLR